ncbi:MAG: hypothetical protein IKP46_01885 [Bacteroidales bacterium]|nr:hypothetical protein [Bacteroidales bacterium]
MFHLRAYCIALLLFLGAFTGRSQERAWTAALDRYEFICRRCASWRDAVDRGERVPKDSLQTMTLELKEVRKNLMYVLGDMSPGQRRWFEAVRDWFSTGEWPVTTGPIEGAADSSASLGMTDYLSFRPSEARGEIYCKTGGDTLDSGLQPPLGMTKKKVSVGGIAGATVGVWPDVSGGVLAGVRLDKWCIFIKGRSNFTSQKASYECNADGTTDYGYFWSSGAKAVVSRHQVTLDVSYAFTNPVSLYLGAGYGVRALYWQDSEGAWAKVRDRSFRSVALDAGLLIHPIPKGPTKGLTFLAGISYIPRTYLDVEAGLAWRF